MRLFFDLKTIPSVYRFIGWDSENKKLVIVRKGNEISVTNSWKYESYSNMPREKVESIINMMLRNSDGDPEVLLLSNQSLMQGRCSIRQIKVSSGYWFEMDVYLNSDEIDTYTLARLNTFDDLGMSAWGPNLISFNPVIELADKNYAW